MSYTKKTFNNTNEVTERDMEKVQTLWKDIQQNKRQLEDTQSYDNRGATTGNLSHYIIDNQELRDKLRLSETQLNDARDKILILSKRLEEANDNIGAFQNHVTKQEGLTAMKTHQLNRLTSQFENLNLSQKEVIERSREANLALINELEEKNRELQNLRDLSKTRVDKLSVVTVSHGQASSKIDRLEEEVEDKNREIAFLKRELEDARSTIHDLQQIKKSEGLAMLEIEHLKADVQRLVKMLKTTKEYSEFADFADDNTGSVRFLKGSLGLAKTHVDETYKHLTGTVTAKSTADAVLERLCVKEDLVDEKELWTPHDAFRFAQEFRKKYNGELTDPLLEKLLFELNRIWSRREQQRISRVKAACAHEVMKLKRKLSQGVPFNEVQAKQTIHRLRNDLKTSYKENRTAFADRADRNPPGMHYVNETMKMAKNSMKIKKQMTKENTFLRDQMRTTIAMSKSQSDWKRDRELDF